MTGVSGGVCVAAKVAKTLKTEVIHFCLMCLG